MYIFWGKVVFQVWLLNNWQRPSIASIDFSLRERQTRERVYLYKTTDCAESALPDDLWHYQRDRQWLGSRAPYSTTSRSWARLAANSHIQDGRTKKSAPWTTRHIYSLLSCLSLIYKSFLILSINFGPLDERTKFLWCNQKKSINVFTTQSLVLLPNVVEAWPYSIVSVLNWRKTKKSYHYKIMANVITISQQRTIGHRISFTSFSFFLQGAPSEALHKIRQRGT